MKNKGKKQFNWKIVIYSVVGLGFLALSFLVDWMFIIGAVVMIWLNQRELWRR